MKTGRRTEEVKMIRHDHVSANHPRARLLPGVDEMFVDVRVGKDLLPVLGTDGYENNDRLVRPFVHRMVHGMFSASFGHVLEGRPPCPPRFWTIRGRDSARPSTFSVIARAHMCSITLSPKAEHLISVAPSICRAKS